MQQCMSGLMNSTSSGHVNGNREEYIADMNAFFADVEDGKVACPPAFGRVVARLVRAAVTECGGASGEHAESEKKKNFKEALEELREAPIHGRAAVLEKRFAGLNGQERIVLMELANDRPVKQKAANNGMTAEEFLSLRHSAMKKLVD